tara:strand:- start:2301 stop:2489 length:189 start_codon:yes stop_codon:yes gene_type:complete
MEIILMSIKEQNLDMDTKPDWRQSCIEIEKVVRNVIDSHKKQGNQAMAGYIEECWNTMLRGH